MYVSEDSILRVLCKKILGAKHNNGVGSESQMQHCVLVWVAAVDEIISSVAARAELTCIY